MLQNLDVCVNKIGGKKSKPAISLPKFMWTLVYPLISVIFLHVVHNLKFVILQTILQWSDADIRRKIMEFEWLTMLVPVVEDAAMDFGLTDTIDTGKIDTPVEEVGPVLLSFYQDGPQVVCVYISMLQSQRVLIEEISSCR